MRALISAVILVVLTATAVLAAEYSYPSVMRLGAGVDPTDPTEPIPYCFEFQTRKIPGSASGTNFQTSLVKNRKEFLREMNVSAAAAAKNTFFAANASLNVDERYSFSEDSVTWLVVFHRDLGKQEIFGEKPTEEFKALLADKDKQTEFATRCGTELVTQEQRKVSIAAVFSANNLSAEQKNNLEKHFSASGSKGAWSGEAEASFRNFVKEASSISRLSLSIAIVGGETYPDEHGSGLAPLFTDFADLNAITNILRSYAAQLNFDNATTTSYTTTKMTRYGWTGNQLDVGVQDLSLADYYIFYRDLSWVKERSYGYLQNELRGSLALTADQRQLLTDIFKSADTQINAIVATANECRLDKSKCRPSSEFVFPKFDWPKLEPVGTVHLTSKTVSCTEVDRALGVEAKYLCEQRVVYRIVAKWPKITGVSVEDIYGQVMAPAQGSVITLRALHEAGATDLASLSEAAFIAMITGDNASTFQEADERGWGAKELSFVMHFGSNAAVVSGLKSTLTFSFTDERGAETTRKTFLN